MICLRLREGLHNLLQDLIISELVSCGGCCILDLGVGLPSRSFVRRTQSLEAHGASDPMQLTNELFGLPSRRRRHESKHDSEEDGSSAALWSARPCRSTVKGLKDSGQPWQRCGWMWVEGHGHVMCRFVTLPFCPIWLVHLTGLTSSTLRLRPSHKGNCVAKSGGYWLGKFDILKVFCEVAVSRLSKQGHSVRRVSSSASGVFDPLSIAPQHRPFALLPPETSTPKAQLVCKGRS